MNYFESMADCNEREYAFAIAVAPEIPLMFALFAAMACLVRRGIAYSSICTDRRSPTLYDADTLHNFPPEVNFAATTTVPYVRPRIEIDSFEPFDLMAPQSEPDDEGACVEGV